MKLTIACISILSACIVHAQIIPQPSILPFVHQVGETTSEQDTFAEAWSLCWNNADMLLNSITNVLTREAQREADFRRDGYTTVSGSTTVVMRHRHTVDLLMQRCDSIACPPLFMSSYESIHRAIESLSKAVEAELSYIETGSTTDLMNLQRYQGDVAEHLAASNDLFWMAVKSQKPSASAAESYSRKK